MNIKDKEGSITEFWQADAIVHTCGRELYGWATFLLPSSSPRRARLAYKIVLGASVGLYWVFKRETYPHEHVIPRTLEEKFPAIHKLSTQGQVDAAPDAEENLDDKTMEISLVEQSNISRVPEAREVIVETIFGMPYDDSSRYDTESLTDTALTSMSPRHHHDFPKLEVESEELSSLLRALQLSGEKYGGKDLHELEWLDLACSSQPVRDLPRDILSHEDCYDGAPEAVVIEDVLDGGKAMVLSQPAEQDFSPSVMSGPEEIDLEDIDLDAAFGMGATDLEDHCHQDDVTVIMSKVTKDSPSHDVISKLEQDRQALFVGAHGQVPQQKPRLQQYIQGDFTAEASEEFANLPKERWNAAGWVYAIGTIKYYYWHAAHKYCSDKGYYQHLRLEESERSRNWSSESKGKEAQRPSSPRISMTEQPPSPKLDEVVATTPYHHENYLMHPVDGKTSTSPETSLWLAHFAYRRKAVFDPITRQGVLASQATKTVDPYQYIGPQEYLQEYTGTKLQDAILGYVNRIYTSRGSWQLWEYEDEAVPMLPSDVEWFNTAEQGYEGMQLPYFMDHFESRDMVVNGDCGIHGPPRRSFPFGEKAKPYFCGSPLRYELWNSSSPPNGEPEAKRAVGEMPSITEEDEEDDMETKFTAAHLPSTTEEIDDGPVEPAEAYSPAVPIAKLAVEQIADSEQCGILDGLTEEIIDLENDDFYGISEVILKDEEAEGQDPVSDGEHSTSGTESQDLVLTDHEVDDDEASIIIESEHGAEAPTHHVYQPIVSSELDEGAPLDEVENEVSHGPDGSPDYALKSGEEVLDEESMQWADMSLNSEESPLAAPALEMDPDSYEDLTDYTNSWTQPVGKSQNPKAAYLAQFSDHYIKQQPENGNKSKDEYLAQWFEGVSKASGKRGLRGEISQKDYLRVFWNDPQNAILSSYWCEVFAAIHNVDGNMPVDNTVNGGNENSDPTSTGLADSEAHSGPSTPNELDPPFEGVSSPPNGDESAATTPDHKYDVDQEISRIEKRLRELYDIKYAAQYTSLGQFDLEIAAKERMPLFPRVDTKSPPEAGIITGILCKAAQHPALDKYVSELTDAMVSKDLRVQPREEPKPEPVVFSPNGFGNAGEAPIPGASNFVHPEILSNTDATRLLETRKAEEALAAAKMEGAVEASELQDLEDNAAINGAHIVFEPVNADVPWAAQVNNIASVPAEASSVNKKPEQVTIQRSTQEDFAEVVPVSPYVNYSDMLELHSALDYNEYIYGTMNFGVAKKFKKFIAKLKF